MASKDTGYGEHPLEERHIGPIPFLHKTSRQVPATKYQSEDTEASSTGIWRRYQSRDNRKGRHAVVISPQSAASHGVSHPRAASSLKAALGGIRRMVVRYPVYDVSYDVAVMFTLGSVIWVVNGFFDWLPVQWPSTEFAGEEGLGAGITALVGATVFEIGSVLLMLEALNDKRADCFGWALEDAMDSHAGLLLRPDPKKCTHHHPVPRFTGMKSGSGKEGSSWVWWPSWSELKTHYFREIGFLASFFQFLGATVFWISGFTALPPIQDRLSTAALNGAYWLPQVVGGVGFIISSWLFMVETQKTWYTPAPKVLGWHIGLWNLIGALGFTLCGALGFASQNQAATYASDLSTFIGSFAFLIGSVIQWYESLDKYPVTFSELQT